MTSIGAEILLPGPFVVLQGMRGDGMANTIDSTPVFVDREVHRPRVSSRGNSHNNSGATAAGRNNSHSSANPRGVAGIGGTNCDVTGVDDAGISTNIERNIERNRCDGNDMDSDSKKNYNRTRASPRILHTQTLGSQSSGELVTSGDHASVPQEISSSVPNDPTAAETSSEGGYHPSESAGESSDGDELFYDDSTSSASSVNPHTIGDGVGVSVRATINHHRPVGTGEIAAIGSDGGLHLPIPPSAVAGMGYNTFLTSVNPSRNDSHSQRHDDSFVLVQGNNNNQRSNNSTNNTISNIMNNSSTNLSLVSTSSSSIVDISRSFSSHNSTRYANMLPQERNSIKQWNRACRQRETQQRNEAQMHANPKYRTGAAAAALQLNRSQWWKMKSNCLAVFETLPSLVEGKNYYSEDDASSTATETITPVADVAKINPGKILGELSPGCTVMGTEMVHIDRNTLQPLPPHDNIIENGAGVAKSAGIYQFLKIESPFIGYVLFSMSGYTYLGPGLPSYYADPEVWTWRVTCPDGAYVRQGLELTSVHVDTIPYGAFVRVTRKTVNAMGLSRLQIEATVRACDVQTLSSTTIRNRGVGARGVIRDALSMPSECSSMIEKETSTRTIVGWISEALNPLSGQSGPIVQPIPFPVPVLYRVTLADGAVIRADVELSSSRIGLAPMNAILTIVGRAYSNHPQDQCIERLKLAGGGGWVSVRLNRPAPRNELVLEMVGIDGAFDPNEPGLYHLERQKQVLREYDVNTNIRSTGEPDRDVQDLSRSLEHLDTNGDISSIEDGVNDTINGGGVGGTTALDNSEISNAASSMTSAAAVPALYRSGVAAGDTSVGSHTSVKGCGSKALADEKCLICLTENRTATIVHGSTGHIACCLMCARILKGRGDRCPVCRLPIDSVIQQFWA